MLIKSSVREFSGWQTVCSLVVALAWRDASDNKKQTKAQLFDALSKECEIIGLDRGVETVLHSFYIQTHFVAMRAR